MSEPPPTNAVDPGFLEAVLDAAPRVLAVLDAGGTIRWLTGDSQAMVGVPAADLVGRNIFEFIPDGELDLAHESMDHALNTTWPCEPMEFKYRRADGSTGVAEAVITNRLEDPRIGGVVLQAHDVTTRSASDHVLDSIARGGQLSEMLRLVAQLVETRLDGSRTIVGVDPFENHFALAASSHVALEGSGWDGDEATTDEVVDLADPGDGDLPLPWEPVVQEGRARFYPDLGFLPAPMQGEARKQGFASCWVFPAVLPATGEVGGCVIVWRSHPGVPSPSERAALEQAGRLVAIALERRDSQEILMHAAHHDSLTSLPNRSLFFDRLSRELQRAEKPVAVLYLDLDHFKSTNDRFGHRAGDHVLVTVARRISDALRPGDLVARLGGDEFGVICPRLSEPREAEQIAERLLAAVAQPVSVPAGSLRSPELSALAGTPSGPVTDGGDAPATVVRIGASIGIAFNDEVGTDHEKLVELADAAMYSAKRKGRGTWGVSTRGHEDGAGLD